MVIFRGEGVLWVIVELINFEMWTSLTGTTPYTMIVGRCYCDQKYYYSPVWPTAARNYCTDPYSRLVLAAIQASLEYGS